ncbi:MAG: ThuA domain-containing protein [Verrucomicrobia bacterium]|nr:MAG: ThuA domain-containing protein [Verrucomicrobiota bacterium]
MRSRFPFFLVVLAIFQTLAAPARAAETRRIVLLSGRPSHGNGEHEFRAGALVLARCLGTMPGIEAIVVTNGWPADPKILDNAAAVVIYADGGDGHPAIQPARLRILDQLAARGVGIGAMHYGVEVPVGDPAFAMLRWTGGYFEKYWSVNPTWKATFRTFPAHPIARGVKPFAIDDEWYYHMRFVPDAKGVTPILATVPPAETLDRPDGPHSGNPWVRSEVARGIPQTLMWAYERPGGGRGFGFTGGHYHRNWGDANFRKLVLNAVLWTAGVEVPEGGMEVSVGASELKLGLDAK